MQSQRLKERQKKFFDKPREIHEIFKFTKCRQVTVPKTLRKILELAGGEKFYWIKSQKKSHADEVFSITIRVIRTKEGL